MRTFPARYAGRCAADCGRPIEVDDEVGYVDDELVHADGCADREADAGRREAKQAACPACFLVHAGECL